MIQPPANGMWPSPFNPGIAAWGGEERTLRIADCTLRDGEQQAGIVMDREAKLEIARMLDELGVYEIEAGTVASSEEDRAAIAAIVAAGLDARISVLCRGLTQDIDLAASLGVWGVRLSFPISEVERAHKLKGISNADYLEKALMLTRHARDKGLAVIFSPYDTTRAEPEFLAELVAALDRSGTVDRLRIVDTTGCALPEAITDIVSRIRQAAPGLALEIHCHNDFGLACANTLAGVRAGADYVSSTINGLGERCGNAATEDVVMALEVLEGYRTGLKLETFQAISRRVEALSRIPVPVNKAVVGANAFRHEAGMVVAGVLKEPFTAESYKPEIVGQKREILLGKKSGLVSVAHKLGELGLTLPQEAHPALLDRVKVIATRERRAVTNDELRALVEEAKAA
ncbi:LeuA family protein [Jiella endophytica]|nr:hypothetical protein [Jiella endophytica]